MELYTNKRTANKNFLKDAEGGKQSQHEDWKVENDYFVQSSHHKVARKTSSPT